ncbi:hypothetical protein [Parashewanella tropica]|uniref:hypothetical protein n=1 Tax=Parashewanella tropica TaxID=2547970 RepID=UPI001059931D|nr:hypothetical protein [Parashewanella tropica]
MSASPEAVSSSDLLPQFPSNEEGKACDSQQYNEFELQKKESDEQEELFHNHQPSPPTHVNVPPEFKARKRLLGAEITRTVTAPLIDKKEQLLKLLDSEPSLQAAFLTCARHSKEMALVISVADVRKIHEHQMKRWGYLSIGVIVGLLFLSTKQPQANQPPNAIENNEKAKELWTELTLYGCDSFTQALNDTLYDIDPLIKALKSAEAKARFISELSEKYTEIVPEAEPLQLLSEETNSAEPSEIEVNGVRCELHKQIDLHSLTSDEARFDLVKALVTHWKQDHPLSQLVISGSKAYLCYTSELIPYRQPYELVEWLCSFQDDGDFISVCKALELGEFVDFSVSPQHYKALFSKHQQTRDQWKPEMTAAEIFKKHRNGGALSTIVFMAGVEAYRYKPDTGLSRTLRVQVVPVSTLEAATDTFELSRNLLNSLVAVVELHAQSRTNWYMPLTADQALSYQAQPHSDGAKIWARTSYQKAVAVLNLVPKDRPMTEIATRPWLQFLSEKLGGNWQQIGLSRYQVFDVIPELESMLDYWDNKLEAQESIMNLPDGLLDIAKADLELFTEPLTVLDTKLVVQACNRKIKLSEAMMAFNGHTDIWVFFKLYPENTISLDALFLLIQLFELKPDLLLELCNNRPLVYRGFYNAFNCWFKEILDDENVSSSEMRWIATQSNVIQALTEAKVTQDSLHKYVLVLNPELAEKLSDMNGLRLAWFCFAYYFKGKKTGRATAALFDLTKSGSLHNAFSGKPVLTLGNEKYYLVPMHYIAPIYFYRSDVGHWTSGAVCDFCQNPQQPNCGKTIFHIDYQTETMLQDTEQTSVAHFYNPKGTDKDICSACLEVKLTEQKAEKGEALEKETT